MKDRSFKSEDGREAAYQQALNLLDKRPRSQAEIRRSLARHGIAEDTIQEVLQRLARSGLVNDEQFASLWVENRQEFRPRSRKALAFEMRQKGIARDAIDQALGSITDQDEKELAYQAASRQARKYAGLEWQAYRQKMAGFLARRGFNYETSAAAIQRTWQDRTASDEERLSSLASASKNMTNERHHDERR
jgi:regulatory protein